MSTTTFTLTPGQIVYSALRVFNGIALGTTPDGLTLNNGIQLLNMMLKNWQTQGLKIWTIVELLVTPVVGQNAYVISPTGPDLISDKPLRILNGYCFSRDLVSNLDRNLMVVSKQEYMLLGDKISQGAINTLMYDPAVTSGTLYMYNAPDTYSATNTQLHIFAQRPVRDINLSTDPFDLPQEWMMPLRWNLAAELMGEYGVEAKQQSIIQQKANAYKEELESWDTEHTSVYFNPDPRMGFLRQ